MSWAQNTTGIGLATLAGGGILKAFAKDGSAMDKIGNGLMIGGGAVTAVRLTDSIFKSNAPAWTKAAMGLGGIAAAGGAAISLIGSGNETAQDIGKGLMTGGLVTAGFGGIGALFSGDAFSGGGFAGGFGGYCGGYGGMDMSMMMPMMMGMGGMGGYNMGGMGMPMGGMPMMPMGGGLNFCC